LAGANTAEVREEGVTVEHPVIDILPGQVNVSNKGGTMRLGGHDVELKSESRASALYGGQTRVRERFRHRYEVNPEYIERLEAKGLSFSGKHPEEDIMQVLELPGHR